MTLIRSRGEYAEQNAGVNTKTAGMREIAGMTTSFQMPLQSTPFLWSDVKNACCDVFVHGISATDEPIRYFYSTASGFYSAWHENSLEYVTTIGNHRFFKEK